MQDKFNKNKLHCINIISPLWKYKVEKEVAKVLQRKNCPYDE